MSTKKTFQKPSVEEIAAYMKERKKEWPMSFCLAYADKFWNSYEKSGWKLSAGRGGQMKSWTAAFNSNWQDLAYEVDRKKLESMKAAELAEEAKRQKKGGIHGDAAGKIGPDTVQAVMAEYLAHPTRIEMGRLASCYEWIKSHLKLRLSQEQIDIVKGIAETDKEKAKATVVGWVFDWMGLKGISIKQLLNA